MKKEKAGLNGILEEDDAEKKFGLIAEEIEEAEKEKLKDGEENEELDEEEFEEEIEDFIPHTSQIKLESEVEGLFPERHNEEKKGKDKDYEKSKRDDSKQERETSEGRYSEEFIDGIKGKKIEAGTRRKRRRDRNIKISSLETAKVSGEYSEMFEKANMKEKGLDKIKNLWERRIDELGEKEGLKKKSDSGYELAEKGYSYKSEEKSNSSYES